MTLRRLEVAELHLILEYEDETGGEFAMAVACESMEQRGVAYGMLQAVMTGARALGVEWLDDEVTERYRPVCGLRVMALVWRGKVLNGEPGARMAEVVRAGLGVQDVQRD